VTSSWFFLSTLVHLSDVIHSHSLILPEDGYKQPEHAGVILCSLTRTIGCETLFIPEYVCYRKRERAATVTREITVVVTPAIQSVTLTLRQSITVTGPEGSRKLRFPDFVTTAKDGVRVVRLTHRPPLPPVNTPGTHFC